LRPYNHYKTMNPNNTTNFSNLEDALVRVPYFAKVLEVWSVPITQEDDGTFQFFGSGRKVYEYKTPYEDIQGSEI